VRCIAFAVAFAVAAAGSAAASSRAVTFGSLDGTTLAGELYEASNRPAPAVVLVHMLTRTRADWDGLARQLQDAGLTALALDLRGHGASAGSTQALPAMVSDVRAATEWLAARPGVRPGAIVLVGASLGANLALLAAVDLPAVRGVAVVSPSIDYRGLRTDTALLKKLGGRPVWMAASTGDPLALRTMRDFAAEASGPREQHVAEGQSHGTLLLMASPDVRVALVDWLRRTLLS